MHALLDMPCICALASFTSHMLSRQRQTCRPKRTHTEAKALHGQRTAVLAGGLVLLADFVLDLTATS